VSNRTYYLDEFTRPVRDDGPSPGNGQPEDQLKIQIKFADDSKEREVTVIDVAPEIDEPQIEWKTFAIDVASNTPEAFLREHYLLITVPFTDVGVLDRHTGKLESSLDIPPENVEYVVTTPDPAQAPGGHLLTIRAKYWTQEFVRNKPANGDMQAKRRQLFPLEVKITDDDTMDDSATIAADNHGCTFTGSKSVTTGPANQDDRTIPVRVRFEVEDPGACTVVNFKQGYMYLFGEKQSDSVPYADFKIAPQYDRDVSTHVPERTIDSGDKTSAWSEYHVFRSVDPVTQIGIIEITDSVGGIGAGPLQSTAINVDFTAVLFDYDVAQQEIQTLDKNGAGQIVSPGSNQPKYARNYSESPAPVENLLGYYTTTPDDPANGIENLTPSDGITALAHTVWYVFPGA
jgi:hypothetical protein